MYAPAAVRRHPYDVPLWRDITVHPDHHISVQYTLYSAPSTTYLPGTKLEARCDRDVLTLYRGGALVKVHPRQPKGGRSTDPDNYQPERRGTRHACTQPAHPPGGGVRPASRPVR